MKVALVIPYNPLEEVGGLELGTLVLAVDLIKCGHEAVIISKGQSGMMDGVPIRGYSDFISLCRSLIVNSAEFDIIHWLEIFPGPGEIELQGMASGLLRAEGKKVILMVATSGNLETRGKGYLITPLLKQTMDAYVISNPAQLAEFASCGIKDNIHIIGFGVNTTEVFRPVSQGEKLALRRALNLPLNRVLCLFMGRFVARKKPDFLLKAWQSMEDVYDRAELVVVGSGMDQHDSIEENVRALASLTKHVHFRDITKNPEKYYQACDLLLLPSEREGQPNVMLEMMACGNPVVGSDIPGLREIIINGSTGMIFPENDQAAFTQAVRRLIEDQAVRLESGVQARKLIVSAKDVRVVTEQYLKLYFWESETGGVCGL